MVPFFILGASLTWLTRRQCALHLDVAFAAELIKTASAYPDPITVRLVLIGLSLIHI